MVYCELALALATLTVEVLIGEVVPLKVMTHGPPLPCAFHAIVSLVDFLQCICPSVPTGTPLAFRLTTLLAMFAHPKRGHKAAATLVIAKQALKLGLRPHRIEV